MVSDAHNQEVQVVQFSIHDVESAPDRSKPLLRGLKENLGMVPNLAAAMAESPELLKGFLEIRKALYNGSFTPAEVQVLALTNAFENECAYCMALHSTLAKDEGVSEETIAELRSGRSPVEPRMRTLSDFSRRLVKERGRVAPSEVAAFIDAGFTRAQALEVVLGVAVSILPNFAHHVTQSPIDEGFRARRWNAPDK